MKKLTILIVTVIFVFFSGNTLSAQNWIDCNNGITNANIQCLASNGNNLYAGTAGDGLFVSTDNGSNWTPIDSGLTNFVVIGIAFNGNNMYIGTEGGGVFMSTNEGTSWTPVNSGITNLQVWKVAICGSAIYAGTWGGGVFRTTNNGTSWVPVISGLSGLSLRIQCMAVIDTVVFAGTYGRGVFRITNNDTVWTPAGLANGMINSLEVSGNKLFAGTQDGGSVHVSTDYGASWTESKKGLTKTWVVPVAVNGSVLFAGTWGGGVFYSSDEGSNWSAVNSGLTNMNILSLLFKDNNIFAGTQKSGVFKMNLSFVDVDESDNNENVQSYPNPAIDWLTISLSKSDLPISNIKIMNSLGIIMKSYDEKELSGQNSIILSTKEFLPGVYFLTIKSGNLSETKKFVVIK